MTNSLLTCKRLLLLLMLLFAVQFIHAQTTAVTGKVTDQLSGKPLPNVSVLVKGTSKGATTGADGSFSLAVTDKNPVLVFSYVGYREQEITVGNNSTINVQLSTNTAQLNDVIVVGYGTQRKK